MKNPNVQYAILGGGLLVLAIILYWQFAGPREPTPEELAAAALAEQQSEEDRETAAVRLASHPDKPLELLRKVFSESPSPRVKGAAALGLGTLMDWQSMPQLLEAMQSGSPELRGHASSAVTGMMGRDFGYHPDAAEADRKRALAVIKMNYPVYEKIYKNKHGLTPPSSAE